MTDQIVNIVDISETDRVRADFGDMDGLINSIKEFGIIEPIVLAQVDHHIELSAGGRRLEAIRRIGWKELRHGRHFVWLDESNNDPYRRKAVELEENLRRQDLSWQEQVLGKKQLLEIMESIHGKAEMGRGQSGFGVRKLAAMLGETPAATSKDLKIAELATALPKLLNLKTKADVIRKFQLVASLAAIQEDSKTKNPEATWSLLEGDFSDKILEVQSESIDLIYTDLPFGVELGNQFRHEAPANYQDNRDAIVALLNAIAFESFRVLKNNRFAVFFFGFNYYTDLITALRSHSLTVNDVPFIWYHPGLAPTQNPYTRFGNNYDAALVCYKGNPQFLKPGRPNVLSIPTEKNKVYNAQQPVELVKFFIETMTLPGATILDLMCGSGTTGVAAHNSGRRSILIEQNPIAIAIAQSRLSVLSVPIEEKPKEPTKA